MVGEAVIRGEGDKRLLVINYKGSPYGADLAQYPQVMKDVIGKLQAAEVHEVVLSEYYERIYNEEQTRWLKQIADLVTRLESDAVWSPSHLGKVTEGKVIAPRHDAVLSILANLKADPFKAYLSLAAELKSQQSKATTLSGPSLDDLNIYLATLRFMLGEMERLELIKKMKVFVTQLGKLPADRGIYHSLFEVAIKPSFIGSRIFFTGVENLELVDQYEVVGTKIYIYKHPDKIEYLYFINPPEYTLAPEKYFLLEKTKEVVAGHRPDSGGVGFLEISQARQYFHKIYVATIADLANKNNISLSVEEKEELANIVTRYTIGYGVMEILLSDKTVTDVYVDSPLGVKPIYLVHSKYGQCQTNVIFSDEEAQALVSRFRALSGRPFDEAHPILDFDLEDLQTRIAVIGKPLSLDGIAFAYRLHKPTPWTLAQFLDFKMFSPFAAGLFSYFVDAQASMLIVGSRGSGKTSMLQAMMQEIPQNLRIIVQEDSVSASASILVERHGVLQKTTVGELIDSLIQEYGCIEEGGKEILAFNPDGIKVFSLDYDGKVKLSRVSQFFRHRTGKQMHAVTTSSGKRIEVTGDHSLFKYNPAKRSLSMARAGELKAGDVIAGAEINVNQAADGEQHLVQHTAAFAAEIVVSVEPLTVANQFIYDFSVPLLENFVCEGIVAHNTQELPVPYLKRLGFNIQRLKTRPPLGKQSEAEVSAEDALRTALRLGDSVLIVGEVRSSIRGNQEVLVVEGGLTKRVPIKEIENKPISSYRVPTLGFDLRFQLSPLAGFVKHPERSKLLEITTRTGRKVTVTHDHSLFTATRDFKIAAIGCKDLKKGDQVVIPSLIPCGFNDINYLNVFDYLPDFRVQNFEEPVRKAISKIGWREATRVAGVRVGDIYNYFRTNQKSYPTLTQFMNVLDAADESFEPHDLRVRRGSSTPIPAILPVNEDFCAFLGYYVSEGYHALPDNGGGVVVLTNSDEKVFAEMRRLGRELFSIQSSERQVHGLGYSRQLCYKSVPLATLISRLGCGRICTEKRVPPIIYGLSKTKIAAFMRALYTGDGSITCSNSSGNSIRYHTTSRKLAEDVAYLLLVFGIVARVYARPVRKGNEIWAVEFKDREMVETFMAEVGFFRKTPKLVKKAWAHTRSSTVYFDKEALRQHLRKYPRNRRHLFRFQRCSKNYLEKVVRDPQCEVSDQLKAFATGEFYLDEVAEVKEIILDEPEPVYDLSVSPSQNFVGGFGGILLHNTEAKALYEAMRVGAVGNVVMGTIHGESAYSIWDRVVNDLGVPTTSFKATDFAIVSAPIRFGGSLKRSRRVIEVTEVKKHWNEDPGRENGFLDWMRFDANKDELELFEKNLEESEWIQRVQRVRGLSFDQIMGEIRARADAKNFLVELKRKHDAPKLIEAEFTVRAHNKYSLLAEKQRDEFGSVDHESLLDDYRKWVQSTLLREALAQKTAEGKGG